MHFLLWVFSVAHVAPVTNYEIPFIWIQYSVLFFS